MSQNRYSHFELGYHLLRAARKLYEGGHKKRACQLLQKAIDQLKLAHEQRCGRRRDHDRRRRDNWHAPKKDRRRAYRHSNEHDTWEWDA